MRLHARAGNPASVIARARRWGESSAADAPVALRLLLVEGDRRATSWVEKSFRRAFRRDFAVTVARTLAAGIEALATADPDVVLVGSGLPDAAGLDPLRAVRTRAPDIAVVVVLDDLDTDMAGRALALGAQDVLVGGTLDAAGLADALRKAAQRNRADLLRRASTDPLTGLANRMSFETGLAGRLEDGADATLLFIDLDRFKVVNDTYGHAVGDAVLRAVAGRIARTAGRAALVARFGGDEFLVALETDGPAEAVALAERLIDAIEAPLVVDGTFHRLSASIGVADASPDRTVTGLVDRADAAMYEAKRHGGTHRCFEPDSGAARATRAELHRGLVVAIDEDQLDVWYQPIVDLTTEATVCVEALVRWTHPSEGPMTPSRFVAAAEHSRLIHELGQFVASRAARDLAGPLTADGTGIELAINVSVVELQHERFAERFLQVLDDAGIPPDRICLEITETTVAGDLDACAVSLGQLTDAGVGVALDDFGSGYASLAVIRKLPLHKVKIDRSLVHRLDDPAEREITRRTIDLLHALGVTVVAEGVEREEQRALLLGLGCDQAQGFLFGRPQPVSALRLP